MLNRISTVYIIFFAFLLLFQAWAKYAELNFSISHYLYWACLGGLLLVSIAWKLKSKVFLGLGLLTSIAGICLFVLWLSELAEIVIRFGFVIWAFGMAQALIEYVKSNDV